MAQAVGRKEPVRLSYEDGQIVVTTGQWESEQSLVAGFAAVRKAGVDFDHDGRESRPRDVVRLVSA